MSEQSASYCFEQLHIDVARNATDDFNPFHDPRRWQGIAGNPFGAPIALGFQLAMLLADRIRQRRQADAAEPLLEQHGLHFSNYELHFAGALRAGEAFTVAVKKTLDQTAGGKGLSNRALIRKSSGEAVLIGTRSDTAQPAWLGDVDLGALPLLDQMPDRVPVPGSPYFLKRKFLNTSNGKNFVLAALADQHAYFDELAERVAFPPLFTAALLSSALLEQAWRRHYDFEADPVVYTCHKISIDRRLQQRLRSNDRLHLLVEGPLPAPASRGLGQAAVSQSLHRCFGLVQGQQILFRANLLLAPLHAILDQAGADSQPTAAAGH
jgi:hypothetical protein